MSEEEEEEESLEPSNSSDEESDSEEQVAFIENGEEEFVAMSPPRNHSYLPGTSNPLFPESLVEERRRQESGRVGDRSLTLPIMVLEGVVIFPGTNLPLRFTEDPWISHLREKIDATRYDPNQQVRIGVVCHSAPERRRRRRPPMMDRNSWMRRSFTLGSGVRPQQPLIPDLDIVDEDHSDDEQEAEDEEQSNDEDESLEQDTERVSGSIAEEFDTSELARLLDENDEEIERMEQSLGSLPRLLVDWLSLPMQEILEFQQRPTQLHNSYTRVHAEMCRLLAHMRTLDNTDRQSDENYEQLTNRAMIQTERIQNLQHLVNRISAMLQQRASNDSLIGRIGTVATISYTFDQASDSEDESRFRRIGRQDQLVVTALGTNRFRILSRVDTDTSDVPVCVVEQLDDEDHAFFTCRQTPPAEINDEAHLYFERHNQVMRGLSQVSPIPYMAYKSVWPWRLVGLIRTALDRNDIFNGLTRNLPSLSEFDHDMLEPTAFSFWMASNLSLKQEERLLLLSMPYTVQRLRFILKKVLEQNSKKVCCKECQTVLSDASHMFTVGGADGTTGAYVNEYGVIHQTVTLREADEEKLLYSGRPELRDSWFPGYTWTITYCRVCSSHLGWKFHSVVGGRHAEDRPLVFWGWTASAVTFLSASDLESDDDSNHTA